RDTLPYLPLRGGITCFKTLFVARLCECGHAALTDAIHDGFNGDLRRRTISRVVELGPGALKRDAVIEEPACALNGRAFMLALSRALAVSAPAGVPPVTTDNLIYGRLSASAVCKRAHGLLSASASRSSARPNGPLARPLESRHNARRITSGSAPCWTAKLNAIAASRAFVSAAELDL